MTCSRCQGLMVTIKLEDAEGSTSRDPILGWRCLLCGEVLDSDIKAHRQRRHPPVKSRARLPSGLMLERKTALKRKETRQ